MNTNGAWIQCRVDSNEATTVSVITIIPILPKNDKIIQVYKSVMDFITKPSFSITNFIGLFGFK